MKKIILFVGILTLIASFYGIYCGYQLIIPSIILDTFKISNTTFFYAVCFVGLIVGTSLIFLSIIKNAIQKKEKEIQDHKKQILLMQEKIGSLYAYKMNYFKLRKKQTQS